MLDPKKFKGGIASVIEMLQLLDSATRQRLLANVAAKDPTLARQLEEGLFTFDDLVSLTPLMMQELVRAVPEAKLVLALRKASDELKHHVFSSMSRRQAEGLRELLAAQPPQKLADVQSAQADIMTIARKLESEGKILLTKKL